MDRELRILILEDALPDAELMQRRLRGGGLSFVARCAQTPESFLRELEGFRPDVILSDYTMPSFDGLAALKLVRQRSPQVPFIFVSGSIGEERAIEALTMGAADYILKDRPARLVPAVQRAIREVEERADRRRLEERYRGIFENAVVGISQTTLGGRYLAVNPALARMYGYDSPEELMASVTDLNRQLYVEPGRREEFIRLVKERGRVSGFESQVFRRDGSIMWVYEDARAVQDNGGTLVGFEGITVDVTQRKHAEEARERLVAILEATPDLVGIADSQARTVYLNRGGRRLIGAGEEEDLTGFPVAEAYPEWARQIVLEEAIPAAMRDGVWSGETALLHRDGREIPVSQLFLAHRGPGGAVLFLSTMAHDLTELRRLEEEVRFAQKMEAIGQMAGGVAHDFNNLLGTMKAAAELILLEKGIPEPVREELGEIASSVERGRSLTRQLLAFSRRQALDVRPVDLNELLARQTKLLRRLIGEDIRLETSRCKEAATVLSDAGQVEQVVLNLCLNARDAMPNGGSLVISTERVGVDEAQLGQSPWARPGDHVRLSVSDTGLGMDEDTLAQIFQPFFTTKEPGQGTGLGLAVVYGIVKQHGGFVSVRSRPAGGTTFEIYLPVYSGPAAPARALAVGGFVGGTETILLADDEEPLRRAARKILERLGYRVIEASDGDEALMILEERGSDVHLVVADVVMPKMGGPALREAVRPRRPELRFLFATGYGAESPGLRSQRVRAEEVLTKPYGIVELAHAVRQALDRGTAQAKSGGVGMP